MFYFILIWQKKKWDQECEVYLTYWRTMQSVEVGRSIQVLIVSIPTLVLLWDQVYHGRIDALFLSPHICIKFMHFLEIKIIPQTCSLRYNCYMPRQVALLFLCFSCLSSVRPVSIGPFKVNWYVSIGWSVHSRSITCQGSLQKGSCPAGWTCFWLSLCFCVWS